MMAPVSLCEQRHLQHVGALPSGKATAAHHMVGDSHYHSACTLYKPGFKQHTVCHKVGYLVTAALQLLAAELS